jgi:hypothetical protein
MVMAITKRIIKELAISTSLHLILLPQKPVNKKVEYYDLIIKNLYYMGVTPDLNDLHQLIKLQLKDALSLIERIKIKVYGSILNSHGSEVADWFELSFNVFLIITSSANPESDQGWKKNLMKQAIQVGYPELDFLNIMESIGTSDSKELMDNFLNKAFSIVETPHIFISHSSVDSGLAEEFADMFKDKGIMTFVANIDILAGIDWEKKLKEEIYKSDELLLILSPKSKNSKWVMIEVGAAWILGKTITPAVMYADVNSTPEPIKKFQAKSIITSPQRKNLVEEIAKRVQDGLNTKLYS